MESQILHIYIARVYITHCWHTLIYTLFNTRDKDKLWGIVKGSRNTRVICLHSLGVNLPDQALKSCVLELTRFHLPRVVSGNQLSRVTDSNYVSRVASSNKSSGYSRITKAVVHSEHSYNYKMHQVILKEC